MKRTSCRCWNHKQHSSTPNQCALGLYCIDGCEHYRRGRSNALKFKIGKCSLMRSRVIEGLEFSWCIPKERVIFKCPTKCTKRIIK